MIILVLSLFLTSCSIIQLGSKSCDVNSDCKTKNGHNAGCWSKFPADPSTPEPKLAGPSDCVCYNNECQSSIDIVNAHVKGKGDLNTALEICDLNSIRENKEECYRKAAYQVCWSLAPIGEFDESPCYQCLRNCGLDSTCHIECARKEW